MAARKGDAGHRRRDRGGFVALALALYAACAIWATWPAVQHVDARYLARPAAGYGEAAAGDHLQLGWAFWLPGHQLERGAAPWADPYSFRPEAEAAPNLQGWLLGAPFWPLRLLLGNVWAYNLIVLLSVVAAGGVACWWLRALGLARTAALAGGLVFALAPYRVGQSTGHLLGLIAFLLPAVLLALERRRFVWAALALAAIPLSGQIHLAMGAVVLALGYAWARVPRADWWKAGAGAAVAAATAVAVQQVVVAGSVAGGGRSFGQVRHYSAELADFLTRGVGAGIEEYVFLGWLTPVLALAGLWAIRRRGGLAWFLGLSALLPCLLALGANLPLYEPLWRAFPRFASPASRSACCRSPASRSPHSSHSPSTSWLRATRPALPVAAVTRGRPARVSRSTSTCPCSAPSRPTARAAPTRRSAATGGCSSCPCSGRTSISARCTSATRGSRRASGRRATRPRRRRPPTVWRGSCVRSRAVPAPCRRGSASASSPCTGALPAERLVRGRLRRPRRGLPAPRRLAPPRPGRSDLDVAGALVNADLDDHTARRAVVRPDVP